MLNIGSIGSAGSTAEYHTAKESQDARGEYQGTTLEGELAKRLGVEGPIDAEALTALYEGDIPQPEDVEAEQTGEEVEVQQDESPAPEEAKEAAPDADAPEGEQNAQAAQEASVDAPEQPEEPSQDETASEPLQEGAEGRQDAERAGEGDRADTGFDTELADLPDLPAKSESATDRRNGDEIIISVPKSVSMLAITYGDNRLMDAIRESNTYAIGLVQGYAQARYREDGQVKVEQTGNLMYARVMHSYDDAGMPHAHEHMGVVNATQRSNGDIVPLDNRQIWANSALIGSATSRVLADKVRDLGYEIQVHANGKGWDIASVPRDLIEANSVRGAEIKDRLLELGTSGHGANRVARYETREFEGKITDPEKLNDRNRALDRASGVDGYAIVDQAKARAAEANRRPEGMVDQARTTITQFFKAAIERHNLAGEHKLNNNPYLPSNIKAFTRDQGMAMSYVALASALDHKEQREAAFKERDVLRHALDYQHAGVTLEKLQTIMQQHKDAGLIIPGIAAKDGTPSAYITTRDSLNTEKSIIEKIESGKGAVEPFLKAEQVKEALQPYLPIDKDTGEARQLTNDQLKAAEAILSQNDRHIAPGLLRHRQDIDAWSRRRLYQGPRRTRGRARANHARGPGDEGRRHGRPNHRKLPPTKSGRAARRSGSDRQGPCRI
jgi:conjugative relaxase-like TrwC/TraI family protein